MGLGNKERITDSQEYQEADKNGKEQQLGARVLSLVHYESTHQPIVKSSFNKAKEKGEKLPGKNSERRNLSYLNRLNRLIEKYGNKAEQRLWQASIGDDLLIKEENITSATWDATRQEYRDNGHGNVNLNDKLKHQHYEDWRRLQKESLEKWADYLGDEHSPYPLWFKVYAWDGMTKMGRYDREKRRYETRNETTVAPYPDADAEILAAVFDVVNRYYGNGERDFYTEKGQRNIQLEKVVQSGSFPKIFNAIQQDKAPIIEPPENPEDVHGEWKEYALGEEDSIAIAARGTGWCVATPSVGRHYLNYGTYGYESENNNSKKQNQAKFILFHLKDEETGELAKNACASIRLGLDGRVAEISGLKKGQALNDSMVPTVEEKVKSLPGGEEFLPKFADKNRLIALDRKMEKGEDLTKEDLEFLYEVHRPIQTLDTYNDNDPRIKELRNRYNIDYALNAGLGVNQIVSGAIGPRYIHEMFFDLLYRGVEVDQLVSGLDKEHMLDGADLKILLSSIDNGTTDISIDRFIPVLSPEAIIENIDTLIDHNADINQLVSGLRRPDIAENLDVLLAHSAEINQLVSKLEPQDIARNLDTLTAHGAKIDVNQLVAGLKPWHIAENLDNLLAHGADIDINQLVSGLESQHIAKNLDTLLAHGANINQIVSGLGSRYIAGKLDTLLAHGANINIDQLDTSTLDPDEIAYINNTLRRHEALRRLRRLGSKILKVTNLQGLFGKQ